MGCGNKDNNFHGENCLFEVVRAIKDIQDNEVEAVEEESTQYTSCFTEPLEWMSSTRRDPVDTRVLVLSTADGSPFHAFLIEEYEACVSIFFRVEDVFENCCATLRVLVPGHRDNKGNFETVNLVSSGDKCCIDLTKFCKVNTFRGSRDFVTVDLNRFSSVQCIADVDLGICN
ncbi:CotY/CotZ family spore coat protein [Neobacillus drentensis]|uniref:CotY/CotZ family spore coat protein n=1 Tax=Neobacillus drentensis TaxID=220684 RepID=UPI002FFF9313